MPKKLTKTSKLQHNNKIISSVENLFTMEVELKLQKKALRHSKKYTVIKRKVFANDLPDYMPKLMNRVKQIIKLSAKTFVIVWTLFEVINYIVTIALFDIFIISEFSFWKLECYSRVFSEFAKHLYILELRLSGFFTICFLFYSLVKINSFFRFVNKLSREQIMIFIVPILIFFTIYILSTNPDIIVDAKAFVRAWRGFIICFILYFIAFCIYYNWQPILRRFTPAGKIQMDSLDFLRTENKMKLRITRRVTALSKSDEFLCEFFDWTFICPKFIDWKDAYLEQEKWDEKYKEVLFHHRSFYRHSRVYDNESKTQSQQEILGFFITDHGILENLRLIYVADSIIPTDGVIKIKKIYSKSYVYEHVSKTKCSLACLVICHIKPDHSWTPLMPLGDWFVDAREPVRFYMKLHPQVYVDAAKDGYKVTKSIFGKRISKKRMKKY